MHADDDAVLWTSGLAPGDTPTPLLLHVSVRSAQPPTASTAPSSIISLRINLSILFPSKALSFLSVSVSLSLSLPGSACRDPPSPLTF